MPTWKKTADMPAVSRQKNKRSRIGNPNNSPPPRRTWPESTALNYNGGMLKLRQQSPAVHALLSRTIASLEVLIACDNAFPTSDDRDQIIRNTLVVSARALGPDWGDIKARLKVDHDYVGILIHPVSLSLCFQP
jgi:hypothetical protein